MPQNYVPRPARNPAPSIASITATREARDAATLAAVRAASDREWRNGARKASPDWQLRKDSYPLEQR